MQSRQTEEAQVGIGTMIVFIATVLVAAVAAGVLIDMSGKLQERSSRTGTEATEQVSSNLDVVKVIGRRNDASSNLQTFDVYLALAPGASDVDLSQMVLQITDGTNSATLTYTSGGASATEYAVVEERDVDGSFTASDPVMTPGDLVYLDIWISNALSGEVVPRTEIQMSLIPEVGNSINMGFRTPDSYGNKLVIELA